MIASIKILFNTKDTFEYLDNQYADNLDSRCNLIFLILGAFSGFDSFHRELGFIREMSSPIGIISLWILSALIGAGFGLLFGRYLITYILFGIGKLIKVMEK
jgi:hypothetical protein